MGLQPWSVTDGTPRVLVAVRHPVMRQYAAELLSRGCGCRAFSNVAAGKMLPAAIVALRPDALVVDACDFPACCPTSINAFPRDRVVVIGPEPDPSYSVAALSKGAAACVNRDNVGEELVSTIQSILSRHHDHGLQARVRFQP